MYLEVLFDHLLFVFYQFLFTYRTFYFIILISKVFFTYVYMHKINILILGPDSFISTLIELKPFLKFNLIINYKNINDFSEKKFQGVICHEHELDKLKKKTINIKDCLKVLACSNKSKINENFDLIINLPTSIKE